MNDNENHMSTDLHIINEIRQNYINVKNRYRKAGKNDLTDRKIQLHHAVISYYEVLRPHLSTNQNKQIAKKYFDEVLLYKNDDKDITGLSYLDNYLDNPLIPRKETERNIFGETQSKTKFDEKIMPEEMSVRAGMLLEELYNLLGFGEDIETRQQKYEAEEKPKEPKRG